MVGTSFSNYILTNRSMDYNNACMYNKVVSMFFSGFSRNFSNLSFQIVERIFLTANYS